LRGYIATRFLSQKGYRVKNLAGGIKSEEKVIVNTQKESSLTKEGNSNIEKEEDFLDLSGLSCPGPLVKIKEKIDKLGEDEKLKVKVSDPGFYNDIQAWSKVTKNSLLSAVPLCALRPHCRRADCAELLAPRCDPGFKALFLHRRWPLACRLRRHVHCDGLEALEPDGSHTAGHDSLRSAPAPHGPEQ